MTTRPVSSYRIDPFDLRLFAAVVSRGTITAGARDVHLSLAAASERLQALEHAIGATLLRRAKSGVTPTDAGRTLSHHAARLERDLADLHADMAAHAHGVRATVRLAGNTAALWAHLPPLLGPLLAAHPALDLELDDLDSPDVLQALRRGRADLGIVADYVDTAGLGVRPFRDDTLVAVLPRNHRGGRRHGARRQPSIAFGALLDHPFVGLPAGAGLSRFLAGRALLQGRGIHHRVRVQDVDTLLALVGQGAGVAVLPALCAARATEAQASVTVRPLADDWAVRRLQLCWAMSGDAPGPAVVAVRDALAPPG